MLEHATPENISTSLGRVKSRAWSGSYVVLKESLLPNIYIPHPPIDVIDVVLEPNTIIHASYRSDHSTVSAST